MMGRRGWTRRSSVAALALALGGGGACASAGGSEEAQTFTVTVEAGPFDRVAVPVAFDIPDAFDIPAASGTSEYRLRAPDGELLPVQIGRDGRARFILDSLATGSSREFVLEPGGADGPVVELRRDSGAVAFAIDGRPVLTYNAEVTEPPRPDIDPVYARGGYVHPIHSPEGVIVTGDYPPDHLHHHGIWAAWTRTIFRGDSVDFWNVADRTGDVLPVALDSAWSGPVHGGFTARHRHVALTDGGPVDALHERWTLRVYQVEGGDRPYWLFDLDVEQRTAGDDSLLLPEYRYGGVAFRGRDDWYGTPNANFLTSEGHGREDGNATRARWTHIGGMAEGALRGVAVLSHPDNFRHPEPVRIHPNEPYFVYAPSQLGEWAIAPGKPHRVRYRYVIYDGPPDPAALDRLWNDFAQPPEVTVAPRRAGGLRPG